MNAFRLVCQFLGAMLLLGWAMVGLALLVLGVTARIERARKCRGLSVCHSCQGPQQGNYCQNCAPIQPRKGATYPMIRAKDLRGMSDAELRRPARRPDVRFETVDHLLGPTVEER